MAQNADGVVITDPYLSSASRKLCITAVSRWPLGNQGGHGYLLLDIDLVKTIEFIMGDTTRRRFQPFFKGVYSIIVVGLLIVVAALLYSAFSEIAELFFGSASKEDRHLKPFGVIIFLTLGLAVFDLGKTTLEEEVLMHKDIFRQFHPPHHHPFHRRHPHRGLHRGVAADVQGRAGRRSTLDRSRVDDAGGGGPAGGSRPVCLPRRQGGGLIAQHQEKIAGAGDVQAAFPLPALEAKINPALAQLAQGKTLNRCTLNKARSSVQTCSQRKPARRASA